MDSVTNLFKEYNIRLKGHQSVIQTLPIVTQETICSSQIFAEYLKTYFARWDKIGQRLFRRGESQGVISQCPVRRANNKKKIRLRVRFQEKRK